MKKNLLSILLCSVCTLSFAQSPNLVINGDFETNNASGDVMDMYPNVQDAMLPNSAGVDGGFLDLITTNAFCGAAQSGSWFVQNNISEYYSAFSLELSSPLASGQDYQVLFYVRACGTGGGFSAGFTYYDSLAATSYPMTDTWADSTWMGFGFLVPGNDSARYLMVNIDNSGLNKRLQFDNFQVSIATSSQYEATGTQAVRCFPNPARGETHFFIEKELQGAALSVTDLNGKVVFKTFLNMEKNQIDLHSLPEGFYLYQVQLEGLLKAAGKLLIH